jgi:AcrR family transcriptional regulator
MIDEPTARAFEHRTERGVESRRRAIDGALAIARSDGLESLSFGRVATAVGMAKSSVQVLFGDRASLQAQTLERGAQLFREKIKHALATSDDAQTTPLLTLCRAWFEALRTGPCNEGCMVTASALEMSGREGPLADLVAQLRLQWRGALVSAAEDGKRVGELSPSFDMDQLVFEIMAIQGAANVAWAKQESREVRQAEVAIFDRVRSASLSREQNT